MTSPIVLVAGRELRQRLRAKAFVISTIVAVAIVLAIGIVTRVVGNDDGVQSVTVAVVGATPPGFADALARSGAEESVRIEQVSPSDRPTAEAALRAGDVDVAVITADRSLLFRSEVDPPVQRAVATAWAAASGTAAAQQLGLSPDQLTAIVAPPPLRAATLEPDDDDVGRTVGIVTAIALFLAVSTFGGLVLMGVVEEKTSAIVELLLARVRAHQLLAGKVIGIGIVALIQFAAVVAAGIITLAISGRTIPTEIWIAVPTTILWFLGGFALFATLFALAGSLVSRQEDAQAASAPVTLTLLLPYFAVFAVAGNPDSGVATVLSMLPPFAPLLMPLRIATGDARWWEVVVAVVLLALAVVAVLRLAAAIYARTVLHRGRRVTWTEAIRLRHEESLA